MRTNPITAMNKRAYELCEYQITHPKSSIQQAARDLDCHPNTLYRISQSDVYKDYVDKRIKEIWHDSVRMAQKQMIELAENNDFRALEFILKSNGYMAPQKIELNGEANIIHVKISEE